MVCFVCLSSCWSWIIKKRWEKRLPHLIFGKYTQQHMHTFCGYKCSRMCVCAFAEQSCEHAGSWYVGMWLSDAFAPQWVSAYAHMLIEKSPPHLQHVCLLLESLFHIFQAIRWLREQITFVIRHDLKQKKNTWNKLSSLLFSEKISRFQKHWKGFLSGGKKIPIPGAFLPHWKKCSPYHWIAQSHFSFIIIISAPWVLSCNCSHYPLAFRQHCHHHRCTVGLDSTQTALYLLMTHQYCDKVLCTTASVLLISLS